MVLTMIVLIFVVVRFGQDLCSKPEQTKLLALVGLVVVLVYAGLHYKQLGGV